MFLLVAYLNIDAIDAIEVGDEVCMTGYIMDIFCIDLGVLLDNRQITTLKEPENHSFHCLFDESRCYNSGFVVLGEKDPESSLHCLGLRLEESNVVIDAGRAAGSGKTSNTHITCRTCTGDASKPVAGYRATVKGTVKDLGDGSSGVSGQPLLNNIELLDFDVGCGDQDGIVVRSIEGECKILPSRATPPSSVSSSKTLVCGRGDIDGKPCAEGLNGTAPIDEMHEVRCCRDCSGINCAQSWRRRCSAFDPDLYARSRVGMCKVGTFVEALDFCRNAASDDSSRLCTPLEVQNSCTKGTGCRFDKEHVWACAYGHTCQTDAECCGRCVNGTCQGEFSLFPRKQPTNRL